MSGLNLAISRFTRLNYWSRLGGSSSGIWGSQAIGKGEGLAPGFGIHWQPAGRGKAMVVGPGIPANRFMTRAFTMALEDAKIEFAASIAVIAKLAEDMCNRGRYKATHKAKMAEAEARGWKNIGRSFEDLEPSSFYRRSQTMGSLNRPESAELVKAKDIGLSDREIRTIASFRVHQTARIGKYSVTREDVIDSGWIDFTFKDTKTGEKFFIEAAVSDFRGVSPKDVKFTKTEAKFGAIPGVYGRIRGGWLIQFYAQQNMDPELREVAETAHRLFWQGAANWRESFYRNVQVTFQGVRSPRPAFKTGTAKTFDPIRHIDARINVPRSATRRSGGTPKFYELRIFTAHPVATSHEFGLAGTGTGMAPMTVATMTGLGEPSWRSKQLR